ARYIQQIAVAADNPPFGIVRPYSALGQWQARSLTPIEQWLVIQEAITTAVVNDPPFGMPPGWLWNALLAQWQPRALFFFGHGLIVDVDSFTTRRAPSCP